MKRYRGQLYQAVEEMRERALEFEIGKRQPPTEPKEVEQPPPAEPASTPRQKPKRVPEPEVVSPMVVERREHFEPELILIPAGKFLMGSDHPEEDGAYLGEQPQHLLYLPSYYLAKTPVTNVQYAAFLRASGHKASRYLKDGKPPRSKEDHPTVWVTWYDAVSYCTWLPEITGKPYRLPSEAEWEKAARGTDGRVFPWGDEPANETRCNFAKNVGDTTPVGQYSPRGDSPYGLVDMAGNVWEWTQSLWGKDSRRPNFRYPYNPKDGREDSEAEGRRVLRGGAFCYGEGVLRCACRGSDHPRYCHEGIGFRVCVTPGQK